MKDLDQPMDNSNMRRRLAIFDEVMMSLDYAYAKHGKELWSRHEFYGVLLEEVDEIWDNIKEDLSKEELNKEILQVMCVCLRYIETGDRLGWK